MSTTGWLPLTQVVSTLWSSRSTLGEVLARVKTHVELYRIKRQLKQRVEERTRELAQSESRYRVLFEDSPLAVIVYDADNWRVLAVNVACTRILGYTAKQWIGQPVGFTVEREHRESICGRWRTT